MWLLLCDVESTGCIHVIEHNTKKKIDPVDSNLGLIVTHHSYQ